MKTYLPLMIANYTGRCQDSKYLVLKSFLNISWLQDKGRRINVTLLVSNIHET